jgi:hypothetical protein
MFETTDRPVEAALDKGCAMHRFKTQISNHARSTFVQQALCCGPRTVIASDPEVRDQVML